MFSRGQPYVPVLVSQVAPQTHQTEPHMSRRIHQRPRRSVEVMHGAMAFVLCLSLVPQTKAEGIYFTNGQLYRRIERANCDGSDVEVLISSGLGSEPRGLTLDPSAGKIYWTDYARNTIQRADLDGSHIETLIDKRYANPLSVSLDTAHGKMYWVEDWVPSLRRANLDGTGEELLIQGDAHDGPLAVAVDPVAKKIYWTDNRGWRGTGSSVRRANLDGGEEEFIVPTGLKSPNSIALDLSADIVYWADNSLNLIQREYGLLERRDSRNNGAIPARPDIGCCRRQDVLVGILRRYDSACQP